MEVNVQLKGLPEVINRLRGIPGGAALSIQWAIIYALKRGRTSAAKAARERYIIPYGWLLKAIGQPRIQGLTGYLHVSGEKAKLSMFPMRDIYPYGVAVQELKSGPPIQLLHAFSPKGYMQVFERETKDTKRYPIRTMVGLSAPQMIGQKTEVFPKLQAALQADVNKELARVMRLVLSGQVVPKV